MVVDLVGTLTGDTLSGVIFVGRNLRYQTKTLSLSPDEEFHPIKLRVSLVEVKVKLREKQVIKTKFDYHVGRNFVRQNCR